MKKIERDDLSCLNPYLNELETAQAIVISEDGQDRYAIVHIDIFEDIKELIRPKNDVMSFEDVDLSNVEVRVVGQVKEMSDDEFDILKDKFVEMLEKQLRPSKKGFNKNES